MTTNPLQDTDNGVDDILLNEVDLGMYEFHRLAEACNVSEVEDLVSLLKYLLYKAEKPSVCPSVCLSVTSLTQLLLHGSKWDFVYAEL